MSTFTESQGDRTFLNSMLLSSLITSSASSNLFASQAEKRVPTSHHNPSPSFSILLLLPSPTVFINGSSIETSERFETGSISVDVDVTSKTPTIAIQNDTYFVTIHAMQHAKTAHLDINIHVSGTPISPAGILGDTLESSAAYGVLPHPADMMQQELTEQYMRD